VCVCVCVSERNECSFNVYVLHVCRMKSLVADALISITIRTFSKLAINCNDQRVSGQNFQVKLCHVPGCTSSSSQAQALPTTSSDDHAPTATLPRKLLELGKHRARLRLYFNGGYILKRHEVTLTTTICGTSSSMITTHRAMSTP